MARKALARPYTTRCSTTSKSAFSALTPGMETSVPMLSALGAGGAIARFAGTRKAAGLIVAESFRPKKGSWEKKAGGLNGGFVFREAEG